MKEKQLILTVTESAIEDVGYGRVRISNSSGEQLELEKWGIIELTGTSNKVTAAQALFYRKQEDIDDKRIMMDNLIRMNVGVSIGDKVIIKKASTAKCKQLTMAPVIPDKKPINYAEKIKEFVAARLHGRALVKNDMIYIPGMNAMTGGRTLSFKILNTFPAGIVLIDHDTVINLETEPDPGNYVGIMSYEDIGGLKTEITRIRETVELPLKHPELFEKLGISPPSGVLLHGPPGTGKTLIAKAVAVESGANFITIQGPEIMDKYYGESEKRLRKKFEKALEEKPSIIFIDEIDSIASKREDVSGEVERRVVAQLLSLMDGLTKREHVIVIAATNRLEAIDEALRRPGRFDREIEIGVPDKNGRKEILKIHTREMPGKEKLDLDYLAHHTHGFVGADLNALSQEASLHGLRRFIHDNSIDLNRSIPIDLLQEVTVTMDDFKYSLREIEPSALREVLIDIPSVTWNQVGGLEKVKKKLRQSVEWPLIHSESFRKLGIRPPKGILLYGPPGTGKTLMARAIATESGANFISIKGPEVLSKWIGVSEKIIRDIFKKAKQTAPCIVFLDEIDAIANPRSSTETGGMNHDKLVNQLLTSIDGLEANHGVIVMASTNRPELIDPALIRAGRFDKLLYVHPPSVEDRITILEVHTKEMPLSANVSIKDIAEKTEKFSGADLEALCQEAGIIAMNTSFKAKKILKKHFDEALKLVHPSITKEMEDYYKNVIKRLKGDIGKLQDRELQVLYG